MTKSSSKKDSKKDTEPTKAKEEKMEVEEAPKTQAEIDLLTVEGLKVHLTIFFDLVLYLTKIALKGLCLFLNDIYN